MKRKIKFASILSLVLLVSSVTGCHKVDEVVEKPINQTDIEEKVELITDEETLAQNKIKETKESVLVYESIPDETIETMRGKSIPSDDVLDTVLSNNTLVNVPYINFNNEPCIGEIIVNKQVAKEVSEIFLELYDKGIQIEEISLVDKYNANDEESMTANNSSAFNYRVIAGTNVLSNHGKGLAIDINPLYNPHVVNGKANPSAGQKYADRNLEESRLIKEGDAIYEAFTKRGWKWGGHWKNPDYQHFEKEI